jgi:hypothetical protein
VPKWNDGDLYVCASPCTFGSSKSNWWCDRAYERELDVSELQDRMVANGEGLVTPAV